MVLTKEARKHCVFCLPSIESAANKANKNADGEELRIKTKIISRVNLTYSNEHVCWLHSHVLSSVHGLAKVIEIDVISW